MTSRDTGWVRLPDGRAAVSTCRRAAPVALVVAGVAWMHCTTVGCYWRRVGCTGGRWGLRAVSTTLGQWIPTLVEQAYSGRLGAGPASNHDHRDPAQTSARERCRRTRDGGAGLYRTNHGLSLLRGPVSTVLTLAGPTSERPAGIVGILRVLSGVPRRYAFNVSTMDTHTPSCLTSRSTSLPKVPARASVSEVMTLTCLRSEETAHSDGSIEALAPLPPTRGGRRPPR